MSNSYAAERPVKPKGMLLTARDRELLEAIYAFDGMMSAAQLQRLFFASWRVTRERLGVLWANGYIEKPNRRKRAALPCMVYWLGETGARIVAERDKTPFGEFAWVKEPRWGQIEHDVTVNDFRLDVLQAAERVNFLEIGQWFSEGVFRSWKDNVSYEDDGKVVNRIITPDGYFEIWINRIQFRLLLELDMATKDNPRFVREKAKPLLNYLKSPRYKERFGHNAGRVLVVTTSERRLRNMKRATENALGKAAGVFFFTTFAAVTPQSVLTAPIWSAGGSDQPSALFTPEG